MITSFYFVLWILIYFLIMVSGNAALANYGFFVALVGVYLIGLVANALCKETIERRNRRDFLALMEIIYTDNQRQLCGIFHRRFVLLAASFIYMVVATVGLLVGKADWLIIIIFGFFAIMTGRQVHAAYSRYQAIRDADGVLIPDNPVWRQAVAQYAERRSTASFRDLCPPPTASEKALRIFNMVISVICILVGAFFVYIYGSIMLVYGTHYTDAVIGFAYGLLALAYGVSDLYTLIKGFNFNILQ